MYITSSIPSAQLGLSSYSVLFLVNLALKINQLNINLYVLRSRNKDSIEYCSSIYIILSQLLFTIYWNHLFLQNVRLLHLYACHSKVAKYILYVTQFLCFKLKSENFWVVQVYHTKHVKYIFDNNNHFYVL